MNYLTLEHISKNYGEKVLFDDITLHVDKGNKVALVAKNGSGKSTLMRVIKGEETSEREDSRVFLHKSVKIGLLEQDPDLPADFTIRDAVFEANNPMIKAVNDYEMAMLQPDKSEALQAAIAAMDNLQAWDYENEVKQTLARLNITDLNKKIHMLSGGQQKRVALAKLLIEAPDFLILDEPTNHLDLEMIEWLETYLSQSKITLFMVTHDRYFLDRVCDVIYELDSGKLYKYKGNYSYYLEQKAIRDEIANRTLEKNKKLLKTELEWVRRMPKARGTKAKARVDAFYALKKKTQVKVGDDKMEMEFLSDRMGKKILECHNIGKAYGDKVLIEKFDYKFKKREKVGIVGVNGAGKSTFLKIVTQQIKPDTGKIVVGDTIRFGYYTQDGITLKDDKTVLDVIRDIAEYIPLAKGKKITASQLLERFLFPAPQQRVYVSQLSGGEKRRLYLLTILMANPNFLILDEPTNDLDILTLNVLEEYLLEFDGVLIVVTHDRYFMDKLVDHLFVFEGDGRIKDFNGFYSEYRLKKDMEAAETKKIEAAETTSKPKEVVPVKENTISYEQRKQINRLENQIEKLEKKKQELTLKFNNPDLTPDQINQLSQELKTIENTIEEKEMEWMELQE